MMFPVVQPENPEALRVPPEAVECLAGLSDATDTALAAFLRFALDCRLLSLAEYRRSCGTNYGLRWLADLAVQRLNARLHQAATAALHPHRLAQERQIFLFLSLQDEMLAAQHDDPAMRHALLLEAGTQYWCEIDFHVLPEALGMALYLALDLLRTIAPFLLGDDIFGYAYFEGEICAQSRWLKERTDLASITPEALARLIEAEQQDCYILHELLLAGEEPELVHERVLRYCDPPAKALETAARWRFRSRQTKARALLQWCDGWRYTQPVLTRHPLYPFVRQVAALILRQHRERRLPKHPVGVYFGEPYMSVPVECAFYVSTGDAWASEVAQTHMEQLYHAEENCCASLDFATLASREVHAILTVMSEGYALLDWLMEIQMGLHASPKH